MTHAARINTMLFTIVIFLSLIAWFQPGLQQTVLQYLTSLKASEINTIVIQRQDLGVIKLHQQNNDWFLQEPYRLAANPLRVATVTALAEKRSYSQFQASDNELATYHLKKPLISVWLNDHHLTIGSEDPINQQRYAMNINANKQSGNNTLQLINGTVFYQLRAALDTFISPVLLPPQTRIKDIIWSDKKLTLDGNNWQLTPDSAAITSDSIARLIQFWQHARASKVETNVPPPENSIELQQSAGITIHFQALPGITDPTIVSIHFLIIQENEQIKLLRTDLQIAYWISPEILKQLTEFILE